MKLTAAALLLILPCVVMAQESPADLLAEGKKLYESRKYKESQAMYEKALAAADAAGDAITAARAKLGLSSLKTFYSKFDEGIVLASEAQAVATRSGSRSTRPPPAWVTVSNISFGLLAYLLATPENSAGP